MTYADAVSVITSFSFRDTKVESDGFKVFSNGRGEEVYLSQKTVEYTLNTKIFRYDDRVTKQDLIKFLKSEQN